MHRFVTIFDLLARHGSLAFFFSVGPLNFEKDLLAESDFLAFERLDGFLHRRLFFELDEAVAPLVIALRHGPERLHEVLQRSRRILGRGQIFDDESRDGDSASGEVDFERLAIDFRSIDADKSFLRVLRLRKTNETDAPFELPLVNAAIGPKQVVETLRGEVGRQIMHKKFRILHPGVDRAKIERRFCPQQGGGSQSRKDDMAGQEL